MDVRILLLKIVDQLLIDYGLDLIPELKSDRYLVLRCCTGYCH